MQWFRWLAGVALMAGCHLAAAGDGIVTGANRAGSRGFATGQYPVNIQICSRQGQAFSCNSLQVLDGFDNLTQTGMDNIMINGGCSDRGNLIYVCTLDTQLGKAFGGTSLIWGVVYGNTTGMVSATPQPVSTVYVYVLN